jgi:hypothetical protein
VTEPHRTNKEPLRTKRMFTKSKHPVGRSM